MKRQKLGPKQELIKKIQDFIGFPPKAVLFTMIQHEFPDEKTKDLEAVMDHLWEKQLIEVWDNGWINGKRQREEVKLTKDDLDWYFGTGRFRQ